MLQIWFNWKVLKVELYQIICCPVGHFLKREERAISLQERLSNACYYNNPFFFRVFSRQSFEGNVREFNTPDRFFSLRPLIVCMSHSKKKESIAHQFKYPQWTNLVLKVVMGKHCLQNWNLSLILSYQPFHSGHLNVLGLRNMISLFSLNNNNGLLLQAEIKLF